MVFSRCSVFATSQFNIFEVQKDSFFCGNTKVFERFCRQAKDLLRTVYSTRSLQTFLQGFATLLFSNRDAQFIVEVACSNLKYDLSEF